MCRLLPPLAQASGDEIVGISSASRPQAGEGIDLHVRRTLLPARLLAPAWQMLRVPRVGRDLDVILAPSLLIPPTRATLAVFVADVAFLRMPGAYPRWGRLFHRRGLRLAAQKARVVLTCSESAALDLERLGGVPRDRMRVIPLGADPPEITSAEGERRRAALGVTTPYVLWVGTREPRKNLASVLAAAALVDIPFVLAGPRGWVIADVEDDARRRGLAGRVTFLGFLDRSDLSALYLGATALCYPSVYEGFGIPVIEAMAHGLAVVTSNVSSLPEAGGDAAILVDPHDPAAIAEALRSLIEDEAARAQRIEVGRAHAARFTWDASAGATWRAMKEAAGESWP